MSGNCTHSLTPLATFMMPIVFGIATWMPIYLSNQRTMAQGGFPIYLVAAPYLYIFLALCVVKAKRYVLFRKSLCGQVVLSCALSMLLWMVFWFGDAWLWMGRPIVFFIILGCALFAGPLVFMVDLARLRGHGGWTVPAGECLSCGYDLAGLPKDAVCPECGKDEGEGHP